MGTELDNSYDREMHKIISRESKKVINFTVQVKIMKAISIGNVR